MGYTIYQALDYLKFEIERYEKKLKGAKTEWQRQELRDIIEWYFERGFTLIQYAKPGEVDSDLIDYFLNRKKDRPDLVRAKEFFAKKEKMEKEAQKSLKGKLKLWLWKLKEKVD